MPKIRRIGIEGFRRLSDINVEMRPMMAMIGANGVGKTSFMDALALLAASANGSLNQSLSNMGGVADVLTRDKLGAIVLHTEMEVSHYQTVEYSIEVEPQGQGYVISDEALTQVSHPDAEPFKHIESKYGNIHFYDPHSRRFVSPEWEYDPLESALSQVPRMFRQPEELRRTLSSVTQYHALDVGRRAPVKLPQRLSPAPLPGENGEDLAPFLYNLRETDPERFEDIEDTLRVAFPGFESLSFPIAAAGMISLTWKDRAFRNPIYVHQLSEGMLRFLWLVSLLHSPRLPTITMIDEPEVSLHPELLLILVELMREASDRTQLIVATHSDRLVCFLEPEEVMVMDVLEDGGVSMTWADTFDLEEWLKDYTLDDVWQMGQIGGRS